MDSANAGSSDKCRTGARMMSSRTKQGKGSLGLRPILNLPTCPRFCLLLVTIILHLCMYGLVSGSNENNRKVVGIVTKLSISGPDHNITNGWNGVLPTEDVPKRPDKEFERSINVNSNTNIVYQHKNIHQKPSYGVGSATVVDARTLIKKSNGAQREMVIQPIKIASSVNQQEIIQHQMKFPQTNGSGNMEDTSSKSTISAVNRHHLKDPLKKSKQQYDDDSTLHTRYVEDLDLLNLLPKTYGSHDRLSLRSGLRKQPLPWGRTGGNRTGSFKEHGREVSHNSFINAGHIGSNRINSDDERLSSDSGRAYYEDLFSRLLSSNDELRDHVAKISSLMASDTDFTSKQIRNYLLEEFIALYEGIINSGDDDEHYTYVLQEITPSASIDSGRNVLNIKLDDLGNKKRQDFIHTYVLRKLIKSSKTDIIRKLIDGIWFDPSFADNHKWRKDIAERAMSRKNKLHTKSHDLNLNRIIPTIVQNDGKEELMQSRHLKEESRLKTDQAAESDNEFGKSHVRDPREQHSRNEWILPPEKDFLRKSYVQSPQKHNSKNTERYSSTFRVIHDSDDFMEEFDDPWEPQAWTSLIPLSQDFVQSGERTHHIPHGNTNVFSREPPDSFRNPLIESAEDLNSTRSQEATSSKKQIILAEKKQSSDFSTPIMNEESEVTRRNFSENRKTIIDPSSVTKWYYEGSDDMDASILRFLNRLRRHSYYRKVLDKFFRKYLIEGQISKEDHSLRQNLQKPPTHSVALARSPKHKKSLQHQNDLRRSSPSERQGGVASFRNYLQPVMGVMLIMGMAALAFTTVSNSETFTRQSSNIMNKLDFLSALSRQHDKLVHVLKNPSHLLDRTGNYWFQEALIKNKRHVDEVLGNNTYVYGNVDRVPDYRVNIITRTFPSETTLNVSIPLEETLSLPNALRQIMVSEIPENYSHSNGTPQSVSTLNVNSAFEESESFPNDLKKTSYSEISKNYSTKTETSLRESTLKTNNTLEEFKSVPNAMEQRLQAEMAENDSPPNRTSPPSSVLNINATKEPFSLPIVLELRMESGKLYNNSSVLKLTSQTRNNLPKSEDLNQFEDFDSSYASGIVTFVPEFREPNYAVTTWFPSNLDAKASVIENYLSQTKINKGQRSTFMKGTRPLNSNSTHSGLRIRRGEETALDDAVATLAKAIFGHGKSTPRQQSVDIKELKLDSKNDGIIHDNMNKINSSTPRALANNKHSKHNAGLLNILVETLSKRSNKYKVPVRNDHSFLNVTSVDASKFVEFIKSHPTTTTNDPISTNRPAKVPLRTVPSGGPSNGNEVRTVSSAPIPGNRGPTSDQLSPDGGNWREAQASFRTRGAGGGGNNFPVTGSPEHAYLQPPPPLEQVTQPTITIGVGGDAWRRWLVNTVDQMKKMELAIQQPEGKDVSVPQLELSSMVDEQQKHLLTTTSVKDERKDERVHQSRAEIPHKAFEHIGYSASSAPTEKEPQETEINSELRYQKELGHMIKKFNLQNLIQQYYSKNRKMQEHHHQQMNEDKANSNLLMVNRNENITLQQKPEHLKIETSQNHDAENYLSENTTPNTFDSKPSTGIEAGLLKHNMLRFLLEQYHLKIKQLQKYHDMLVKTKKTSKIMAAPLNVAAEIDQKEIEKKEEPTSPQPRSTEMPVSETREAMPPAAIDDNRRHFQGIGGGNTNNHQHDQNKLEKQRQEFNRSQFQKQETQHMNQVRGEVSKTKAGEIPIISEHQKLLKKLFEEEYQLLIEKQIQPRNETKQNKKEHDPSEGVTEEQPKQQYYNKRQNTNQEQFQTESKHQEYKEQGEFDLDEKTLLDQLFNLEKLLNSWEGSTEIDIQTIASSPTDTQSYNEPNDRRQHDDSSYAKNSTNISPNSASSIDALPSFLPPEMTERDYEIFVSNLYESMNKHEEWSSLRSFPPIKVTIPRPENASENIFEEGSVIVQQSSGSQDATYYGSSFEQEGKEDFEGLNVGNERSKEFLPSAQMNPTTEGNDAVYTVENSDLSLQELAILLNLTDYTDTKKLHIRKQNEVEEETGNLNDIIKNNSTNSGNNDMGPHSNPSPVDNNDIIPYSNPSPVDNETDVNQNPKGDQKEKSGIGSLLSFLNPNKPEILHNINKVLDLIIGSPNSRSNDRPFSELLPADSHSEFLSITKYDFPKSRSELKLESLSQLASENTTVDSEGRTSATVKPDTPVNLSTVALTTEYLLENVDQTTLSGSFSTMIGKIDQNQSISTSTSAAPTTKSPPIYVMMSPIATTALPLRSVTSASYPKGKDFNQFLEGNFKVLHGPVQEYQLQTSTNLPNIGNETNQMTEVEDNKDYSLRPSKLLAAYRFKLPQQFENFNYNRNGTLIETEHRYPENRLLQDTLKKSGTIDRPLPLQPSLRDSQTFEGERANKSVLSQSKSSHEEMQNRQSQRNNQYHSTNPSVIVESNDGDNPRRDLLVLIPRPQPPVYDRTSKTNESSLITSILLDGQSDQEDTHTSVDVASNYHVFSEISPEAGKSLENHSYNSSLFQEPFSGDSPPDIISTLTNDDIAKSNEVPTRNGFEILKPANDNDDNATDNFRLSGGKHVGSKLNVSHLNFETFSFGYNNETQHHDAEYPTEFNDNSNSSLEYEVYSYIMDTFFDSPSLQTTYNLSADVMSVHDAPGQLESSSSAGIDHPQFMVIMFPLLSIVMNSFNSL